MVTEYFLASNSGRGFYSIYDVFPGEGDYLHIIKGGPGTGKSGFMRKLGEAAVERGMDCELIRCSGDPDSLDGLYIPQLKQAWMDGTAPHAREPGIFGVDSDYVNLGEFCSLPLSKEDRDLAGELNTEYKALYHKAYGYLAAEEAVTDACEPEALKPQQLEQMEGIVSDIIDGERRRQSKAKGRENKRFLSSISCKGNVRMNETVNKLCKQYYCFAEHLHAHQILDMTARLARERGLAAMLCPEPLRPERIEALLLPDLGLCFAAAGEEEQGFVISFGNELLIKSEKYRDIKTALRSEAIRHLSKAKALHDELEAVYRPYMDFAALDEFTVEYINKLF